MSYRQKQSDIAAETEMWERNKHSNNCNVRIATDTTEADCNCSRRYKLEPPADISGITMQVSEQRLGRIQTRTLDASELGDIEWRNGYPWRDGKPIPDPDFPNPGRYENEGSSAWPLWVMTGTGVIIGLVIMAMVIMYGLG